MSASAEDPTVIQILMGMKEDLGEIRANSVSMKETMERHIVDDKAVAARVTALEMRVEREKGFMRAGQLIATGLGAAAGYSLQFVISWFRHRT